MVCDVIRQSCGGTMMDVTRNSVILCICLVDVMYLDE